MDSTVEFICMNLKNGSLQPGYYDRFMHPDELKRIKNAVEKRQMEYIFGRLCAKTAYEKICKSTIDFSKLCILNDCCGAPYFKERSCLVSITHDSDLAAAIVFDRKKLHAGIDLQKISSENTQTIFSILCESEMEILRKQSAFYGMDYMAAAAWVAKEALSKLLGYGLSVINMLKISGIEITSNLTVRFEYLKHFSVLLREYKDYLFGFATQNENIKYFESDSLAITETIIKI